MKHVLSLVPLLLTSLVSGQVPERRVPGVLPPVDVDRKDEAAPTVGRRAPVARQPAGAATALPPAANAKADPPHAVARPIPRGAVTYADARDGSCWAVGDSFKAHFGSEGLTFVPFFGSDAERSWPLGLAAADAGLGVPLAAATVTRNGSSVTIDRGRLREEYVVDAGGVEQRFVLPSYPSGEDLVLRLAVTTDLMPGRDTHGLTFACALGHVGYTSAVAFDGSRRPVAVTTDFRDGAIVLRIAGAQLAAAVGPLTIDPRLTTFLVAAPQPPNDIWLRPDVAHGDLQRTSAIVYERAYSADDHDVYSQLCDSQGALIAGTGAWIDVSRDYWSKPHVAYQAASRQFLVVAEHGPNGNAPPHDIVGRIRNDTGIVVGPVLAISGGELGSKVDPVVGGDSNPRAPSSWCVVWQRNYSPTDYDIHYAMVQQDGSLAGGVRYIDNSAGTIHYQPSISRSNGSHLEALQRWNIVFLHQVAVGDIDVWFARVNWDGTIYVASRYLDTDQAVDYNAVATTATEGDLWLACYERLLSNGDTDIVAKIMGGPGFGSGAIDLTLLENAYPSRKQRRPRADSDGCRFTVAYEELYPLGVNDWDVHVSTFHVSPASSGFQLGVSEAHAVLANTTDLEYDVQLASAWGANWSLGSSRTPQGRTRYLAVWTHANAIEGAVYEGRGGFGTWISQPTGCGLGLGATGVPSLGAPITLSLSGAAPAHAIFVGAPLPAPLPLCPGCSLGFDPATSVGIPLDPVELVIPCEPGLLGARIAFQGIDFTAGGCSAGYRLSNTVVATVD
ncbi:MAG: hypothetical protein R3F56_23275 [Planctomycetota bacterium]